MQRSSRLRNVDVTQIITENRQTCASSLQGIPLLQQPHRDLIDHLREPGRELAGGAGLAGEAGGAAYHAGHDAARAADGAGGPAMGDVAAGAVVGAVAARVTTNIAAQPGTDRAVG